MEEAETAVYMSKEDFVDVCFLDVKHEHQPLVFGNRSGTCQQCALCPVDPVACVLILIQHHKWGSRVMVVSVLSSLR